MKSSGWLEEIQNYIDSSSEIAYTTATDLFIGQVFTFENILTAPSLTLYEEGGDLIRGRVDKQMRNIRYVVRAKSVQDVLDRAHAFYEFMVEVRVIASTNFKTQMYRVFRAPAVVDVINSNIYMADIVIGYIVTAN